MERLQGLRPRSSGAWRRDDELRLRSCTRRQVRPASRRAADVARLPRRRRADEHGDPGGTHVPPPHRQGPARVLRRTRGGLQMHRGRPDDVGHAACPDLSPNLPARARERVSASDHRAYQGRPLGDGEPRQSAGRRREADRTDGKVRHRAGTRQRDRENAALRPLRARHRARQGEPRPSNGGRDALRARVHLREHPLARGTAGGNAVGAVAQAARERARPPLD